MSDLAVPVADRTRRRQSARSRRRREDMWIGWTALLAAMLALPLAQSSTHGPEVAATLAVSAVALLAGQRWAVALIVIAQILLVPTVVPRAFLGGIELWPGRIAAIGSTLMIVPGLLAARRAAAALVLVTGWRRTRATCRRLHAALVAGLALAITLPLV
jgi:hypothetical protein